MRENILKTVKLSKKYGKTYAVDSMDITIKSGDIYGLIGENGAGKTTLIRMITGLIHKTSGDIELLNEYTDKGLNNARVYVGSLIETPCFYGNMTAKENLEVSRVVRNIAGEHSIDEVLNLVGLSDVGKKKVKNFSLGMKQKLGIANALLGKPKFLILDEPTNGLDPMGIIEIRELLKKINKEKKITILISSHILGELSELATTYGIVSKGKLIEEISSKKLEEKCRGYINLRVDNVKKTVALLEEEFGIVNYEVEEDDAVKIFSNLDSIGEINSAIASKGIVVNEISLKGEKLEDYFMKLMRGKKND